MILRSVVRGIGVHYEILLCNRGREVVDIRILVQSNPFFFKRKNNINLIS